LLIVTAVLTPAHAQETPVVEPTEPVVNLEEVAEDAVQITQNAAEATVQTVDSLLQRLLQTPQSQIVKVLLVVGGVILLFVGWRIYHIVILLAGFLVGAAFAAALVGEASTLMTLAAILIGGLIGAVLSYFLYYVAVFVIGAYIGILITGGLANVLGLAPVSPLVLLFGAVIGGAVLLALSIELLVILSALVGAQMITLALGLGVEWTLILAVIGVIIQLLTARYFRYDWRRRPSRYSIFRRPRRTPHAL
jgi:hypothetical protein